MELAFRRSTSQRRTYRSCGQKWLLRYGQGWQAKYRRGTYAFGDACQTVLDNLVTGVVTPDTAGALFSQLWAPFEKDPSLTWTSRASWKLLADRGPALVAVAGKAILGRIGGVQAPGAVLLNRRIEYKIGGEVDELAIPDYVGPCLAGPWAAGTPLAGQFLKSILDYKTSDREYDETAAEIDEQVTDYQLAEDTAHVLSPEPVQQVGLCVLVYSGVPRVQWLLHPRRDAEELARFTAGAIHTDRMIRSGVFVRDDRACRTMGACDYLSLCYPSLAGERDKLLVRDERKIETDVDVDW